MKQQTLVIYKSIVLYKILDELRENLKFKILFVKDKELLKFKNLNDYLVISQNIDLKFNNQLILNNLPLTINKLIETINIIFIKKKFTSQSDIKIGKYVIDINSRNLLRDGKKLQLTEKETEAIKFLKNSKKPINISELQSKVWGYKPELETHTVETHIYRLRKKINDTFNDKKFIISSKTGYSIKQ